MYKKNTIAVTISHPTVKECILHFVNRPTTVEVQLYKDGNPNKRVSLGCWYKAFSYFIGYGKSLEWPIQKLVAEVILKQNAGIKTNSFKTLKIEYFGEQTVLRNLYEGV